MVRDSEFRSPPRQEGIALILVLWIISLMSIMAGSYALSTQREAAILAHAHERARATAAAEGAVHYAMMMVGLQDKEMKWQADGTPYIWQAEDARVRIAIFDEGGKIDLNSAQEGTLRLALNLILGDQERATRLADTLLDWRDPDDLKRMGGAEREDYEAAGLKQFPQNRNFLLLEELRGVMGITPEIYRKLAPWFTVYTRQDGLNPLKASREVLLKLAKGDAGLVDNYLIQRKQGLSIPFPPFPGLRYQNVSDRAYTVLAQTEIDGKPISGVVATLRRDRGLGGAPFAYLNWKEQRLTHRFNQPPANHPPPQSP